MLSEMTGAVDNMAKMKLETYEKLYVDPNTAQPIRRNGLLPINDAKHNFLSRSSNGSDSKLISSFKKALCVRTFRELYEQIAPNRLGRKRDKLFNTNWHKVS